MLIGNGDPVSETLQVVSKQSIGCLRTVARIHPVCSVIRVVWGDMIILIIRLTISASWQTLPLKPVITNAQQLRLELP